MWHANSSASHTMFAGSLSQMVRSSSGLSWKRILTKDGFQVCGIRSANRARGSRVPSYLQARATVRRYGKSDSVPRWKNCGASRATSTIVAPPPWFRTAMGSRRSVLGFAIGSAFTNRPVFRSFVQSELLAQVRKAVASISRGLSSSTRTLQYLTVAASSPGRAAALCSRISGSAPGGTRDRTPCRNRRKAPAPPL
jgi:hypothetical protein